MQATSLFSYWYKTYQNQPEAIQYFQHWYHHTFGVLPQSLQGFPLVQNPLEVAPGLTPQKIVLFLKQAQASPFPLKKTVPKAQTTVKLNSPSPISSFDSETFLLGEPKSTLSNQTSLRKNYGKYQVLEKIASGGMGVVYRVQHPQLQQVYALKTIIGSDAIGEEAIQRFYREAKTTARLKHPGIIQIIDFGKEDQDYYLVMEYVEGTTLAHKLLGGLDLKEGLSLYQKVLEALEFAHNQGIIHRDLKPENIFVTPEGQPKIGDFGLARDLGQKSQRLTQSGVVMGTPTFMAPEQALGEQEQIDARTDLYSVGVCLYELATQRYPFEGRNMNELLYNIVHKEPEPPRKKNPKIPADLDTLILKSIAKNKEKRYGSAKELGEEIQRFLEGKPILAKPTSIFEKTLYLGKRHISVLLTSLFFVLLFGVYFGYTKWEKEKAVQAKKNKTLQTQQETIEQLQALYHKILTLKELPTGFEEELTFEFSQASGNLVFKQMEEWLKEITLTALEMSQKQNKELVGKNNYESWLSCFFKALGRIEDPEVSKMLKNAMAQASPLLVFNGKKTLLGAQVRFIHDLFSAAEKHPLILKETKSFEEKLRQLAENYLDYGTQLEKKQARQAMLFYQVAIYLYPLKKSYLKLIQVSNKSGNLKYAFRWSKNAVEQFPEEYIFYFKRGYFAIFNQNYLQATEDFNYCLKKQPGDAQALCYRGLTFVYLEKYSKAIQDLDRAISLDPKLPLGYNYRGMARLNDLSKKEPPQRGPEMKQFRHQHLQEFRQAEKDFLTARELAPTNYEFAVHLGELYFLFNQFKEADTFFEEAKTLNPAIVQNKNFMDFHQMTKRRLGKKVK